MMKRTSRTAPTKAGKTAAFTLVELLVSISIIVLLVGILVPLVSEAYRMAEKVRCQARVAALQSGCHEYKDETGYFPGQLYIDHIGPKEESDQNMTGSQCLARTLYDEVKAYVPFEKDKDLIDVVGQTSSGGDIELKDSVSDRFSEPMAVLYFPARLGAADREQYDINDNIEYVRGNGNPDDFSSYVADERFGGSGRVLNRDGFIIVAAGKDRLYFTGDDIRFPAK